MAIWEKLTGRIKDFKFLYVINNLLNSSALKHNRGLYKKYGVTKSVYSGISRKDLLGKPGKKPWLDTDEGKEALKDHPGLKSFPDDVARQILDWPENGFLVLEKFFPEAIVDGINREIDGLMKQKKVDFNYTGKKIMFAFRKSRNIREVVTDSRLLNILNFILGKKVIPFQTINFIRGSEQKAHSDFIHMATHPEGYLIAAWIALEDTDKDNGPLFYYPGSHRLPYIYNSDFPSGNTRFMLGKNSYKAYEEKIQQMTREKGLQKKDFYAKKGDLFIWHANLLHGGNPVLDPSRTRKSMVAHYFAEGVICYHEITQRPVLFSGYPRAGVQVVEED